MAEKKDSRPLGRRRRSQAKKHGQDALPGTGKIAKVTRERGKKLPEMEAPESAEAGVVGQESKRDEAPRQGLMKLINPQDMHFKEFSVERLGKFRPSGVLSRAEKLVVRRRLALVAVSLTLLAAALAGIGNYLMADSTPHRAVTSYLKALKDGDYLAALGRSVYRDDSLTFLKDSTYRAAENRVEDFTILSIDEYETTARATVEVVVAGRKQTLILELHKVQRTGIFNDAWELDYDPHVFQYITAPLPLDALTINGRKVNLEGSNESTWKIPLLAGSYTVGLPENSYYALAQKQPRVNVGLEDHVDLFLNLSLRPSERMWKESNEAIHRWLDHCERSTSLAPRDCPVSSLFADSGLPLQEVEAQASPSPSPTARTSKRDSYVSKVPEVQGVSWTLVKEPSLVLVQSEESPTVWRGSEGLSATFLLTYSRDGIKYRELIPFTLKVQVESRGQSAQHSVSLGEQGEAEVTSSETPETSPETSPEATPTDS